MVNSLKNISSWLKRCWISISTIRRCYLQWSRELSIWITHHDVKTFRTSRKMWFSQMVQGTEALALTQWRVVIQCPSEVCTYIYISISNDKWISMSWETSLELFKTFFQFSPLISRSQERWHNPHYEGEAITALRIESSLWANQQADSKWNNNGSWTDYRMVSDFSLAL